MIRIFSIFFTALSVLLLNACTAQPHDIHETRFIMGTLVKFTVVHNNSTQAKQAIRAAAQVMQTIEGNFTIYGKQNNPIKSFNQSPINTPFIFPQDIDQLLNIALHVQTQSHGGFNINLAELNQLWGFSQNPPPQNIPDASAIQQLLPPIVCLKQQQQAWLRLSKHCQLDFGAIAKGYAIDRGIETLKKHGIKHAMINAGGDIRIIGKHAEHDWRIAIRHPRQKDRLIGIVSLHGDYSIVTSGDYERYISIKGKRYHHILNPQTGYPSQQSQSTTIIAKNATLADAWSTAIFVAGAKKGLLLASKQNMQALIVDAQGHISKTKNFVLGLPPAP